MPVCNCWIKEHSPDCPYHGHLAKDVSSIPSTSLLAFMERAELAEATLERLALEATDGYAGGAARLVMKWLQDTKANAPAHVRADAGGE